MRLLVYILTIGILLFNLQLRGQEINSYNVNAILDVDNKSIEIKQIMKFRNTSNIELNEIFLEDWSNSYINNETKLANVLEYCKLNWKSIGENEVANMEDENVKTLLELRPIHIVHYFHMLAYGRVKRAYTVDEFNEVVKRGKKKVQKREYKIHSFYLSIS